MRKSEIPVAPGMLGEELKLSSGANAEGEAESPEVNVEGPVGAEGEELFRPVRESHIVMVAVIG